MTHDPSRARVVIRHDEMVPKHLGRGEKPGTIGVRKGPADRLEEQRARELGEAIAQLPLSYSGPTRGRYAIELLRIVESAAQQPLPRGVMEGLLCALGISSPLPGTLRHGRKEPDKFIAAMMEERRYFDEHGRAASQNHIARKVKVSWRTVGLWRDTAPDYWLPFGGDDPRSVGATTRRDAATEEATHAHLESLARGFSPERTAALMRERAKRRKRVAA